MTRAILVIVSLLFFSNSLYAGIDKEYSAKTSWWTPHYNKLLSYLGLEKSYALVIGVGSYDDKSFSSLPSEKDAIRIKDYLINEAGFDHVRLITGDKVNMDKIRYLMADYYRKKLTDKDRFLFYWSGHGVTTRQSERKLGYLTLKTSFNDKFSTMLSMRELSDWDSQFNVKQTLYLLDACFSGIAASKAMSIKQEQTIDRVNRPSRQVLAAGLENQQTIAVNDIDGGVFTKAVLDGLRGKADTETGLYKKDGVVTARELEEFVRTSVDRERRRVNWPDQITPVLYNFSQYEGDFFFVHDKQVVKAETLLKPNQPVAEGVIAAGIEIPETLIDPEPQPAQQPITPPIATRKSFEPEMVSIPAGSFTMGCVEGRDDVEGGCLDREKPAHKVTLSAFSIGKYEVTFDEWDACEKAKACPHAEDSGWGRGKRPVINVSWNDTQKYIKWLNQQTGKDYRLPTEAEWEYAARAGGDSAFPWGNSISCKNADFWAGGKPCYGKGTSPVGSFSANGFGLYDTVGNVLEWTQDRYGKYENKAAIEPKGATAGDGRVIRGGSWFSLDRDVRSASRYRNVPSTRSDYIGFRLLLGQ